MPKDTYLVMCIDAELKSQLHELAQKHDCNLSAYVSRGILRVATSSSPTGPLPDRQPKGAHLTIRVGNDLKAALEDLAADEYRTLANFFEMQLHGIVAAYEGNQVRPACAVERRKYLKPHRLPPRGRVATSLNVELKRKLKKLADEDHRDLGNFIEVELCYLVAIRNGKRAKKVMPRRPRSARLVMRISSAAKARLQRLSDAENRSLSDFIEMRLRKIATVNRRVYSRQPSS